MNKLKALWFYLEGKKSYLVGVLLAVYSLLKVFGVLNFTPEQDLAVLGLLGAMFGMSLRAGMKK